MNFCVWHFENTFNQAGFSDLLMAFIVKNRREHLLTEHGIPSCRVKKKEGSDFKAFPHVY